MSITEREIESYIDAQLVLCGWEVNHKSLHRNVYKQQPRTPEEKQKLEQKRPDYVLYAFEDSDKATVVIEAKKPGESLTEALEQGKGYARRLGASLVIATDGYLLKSWHMEFDTPLFLDAGEVDELFSPDMAQHFKSENCFSSFSKDSLIKQDALIKKFQTANDILKSEGLSAGVERFQQFANLMFLKLTMERGEAIAGFTWKDLENKNGSTLLVAVENIFKELKISYNLFEQTKIKAPQTMEKLVAILSSFRLLSVRADVKGMAFEHFIHSYTRGTKNDLGQYFTPRHIIKMMVHFLKPQIGETIYDPFCGTGGMLLECFRYISGHITGKDNETKLKKQTLFGRDNSDTARIAMMNMIMFGDGHSNIEKGDSFFLYDKVKGKYDIAITNIPFSQDTEYYNAYPIPKTGIKNGDSIAVQHCLESLKKTKNARAAIIVPIGFLYKKAMAETREYIMKNYTIDKIVELSPKCFNPYTEQQTAVLFIKNKQPDDVLAINYYRVKDDGFSQDGYRVPMIGENDIDRIVDNRAESDLITNFDEKIEFKQITFLVRKGEYPLKKLANIRKGDSISPKKDLKYILNGIHPIMMTADLAKKGIDFDLTESKYLLNNLAIEENKLHLFPERTILIPTSGKATLLNHRCMLGKESYLTSTIAGIEAKVDQLHPYCLFYFFLRFDSENIVYDLGYPGIKSGILGEIPIPNYSDSKQKFIIEQVEELVQLAKEFKSGYKKLHDIVP